MKRVWILTVSVDYEDTYILSVFDHVPCEADLLAIHSGGRFYEVQDHYCVEEWEMHTLKALSIKRVDQKTLALEELK